MTGLFTTILNMSITASFVALAVCIIRVLLKGFPKIFSYTLWLAVLVRLVCPFSFKSAISFLNLMKPKAQAVTGPMEYIPRNIGYMQKPAVDTGISRINNAVNSLLPPAAPIASANPMQIIMDIAGIVWAVGVAALLVYSIISYARLKNSVKTATLVKDNIFETDRVDAPFVCGFLRPRIYIPLGIGGDELEYILAHEQTHIKRLDYLIKPIAFLVLILHWFNPLMWVSFALMNKDMEMSCDESVIRKMGGHIKNSYSNSLLNLSVRKGRLPAVSPLAFGESRIKSRIKNILAYKKPAFWVTVVAIVVVAAFIVVLTANPIEKQLPQARTGPAYNAEKLYAGKTPYVGDNSKVSAIVNTLDFPGKLTRKSIELHTGSRPYGMTVYFSADTASKDYYKEVLHQDPFLKNSIIMFSLIGNVEYINFSLSDGQDEYIMNYTRSGADDVMGEDVRLPAENLQDFESFLKRVESIENGIRPIPESDRQPDMQNVAALVEENLEIIMSSPKESSNPQDYIKAHRDEYETILKQGEEALNYLLTQFELSSYKNDLRDHIMMSLCKDLLGDRNNVTDQSLPPREWFSRLSPYQETKLPDFRAKALDAVEQLVYDAAVNKYSRPSDGFTVVAPTIHGSYEEGNRLRVFVTVFISRYKLYNKTLSEVGGSVVPAAITFSKNNGGSYALEQYLESQDGAHWAGSIKEFCVMPGSGREIRGLAEKIIADYRSNEERRELLMRNLIEHLKSNNLEGITLKRVTDELVPLT